MTGHSPLKIKFAVQHRLSPRLPKRRALLLACALSFALTRAGSATAAVAADPSEARLIEALILEVENMHDAKFVRNGISYDAGKAASHLRDKLAYFKDEIHTADDFIRLCATRSEMTGLRYKVRDASGVSQDAAEWLYTKLTKLRSDAKQAQISAGAPPS